MTPFDKTNPEHCAIVRKAAEAAYDLCGAPLSAAKEALADNGIEWCPAVNGHVFAALEAIYGRGK